MAIRLDPDVKREHEQVLGLVGSYDKNSLRKAYLAKVKEWHPDAARRTGKSDEESNQMMAKINQAFVDLTGLIAGPSTTVQCEAASHAGSTSAAGGTASASGTRASHTNQSKSTAGTSKTRRGSHTTTSGSGSRSGASAAGEKAGTSYSEDKSHAVPTDAKESCGEVPRNMAAAMRYTRIVTSPAYVKWFVSGIGPHVMWVLMSLAILFLVGLGMSGMYGIYGIMMTVRLLPFAIIYDVVTGGGAKLVSSLADIWAVNKAVDGTK